MGRLPAYLGQAFGTTYAAQTGDAVSGVIVGQIITDVGNDFVERVLSPSQEDRVATVVRLLAVSIGERLNAGQTIRDDGFFEDEAQSEELLEGVLLAARDSYEKKKLPYLANMFAHVAINTQIDAQTAHLLIRNAEQVSWLEICLLAMIGDPSRWEVPDVSTLNGRPGSWPAWTVYNTLTSMRDRFMFSPQLPPPETPEGLLPPLPETDFRLSALRLNNAGVLLFQAMDLQRMPDEELVEIRDHLRTIADQGVEDDPPRG